MDEIDLIVAEGIKRNLENKKKECYCCHRTKSFSEFVTARICSHGKRNICKECHNKNNSIKRQTLKGLK